MAKSLRIASKIETLPVRKQVALFEALGPWLWRMDLPTESTPLYALRSLEKPTFVEVDETFFRYSNVRPQPSALHRCLCLRANFPHRTTSVPRHRGHRRPSAKRASRSSRIVGSGPRAVRR